jgi:hypothetical protein
MKTIVKRLCRLEERSGLGSPEAIERTRRLFEALERGRRRVAEAEARGECAPITDEDERTYPSGLTRVEILHLGRQRARERSTQVCAPGSLAPAESGGRP